MLEISNLSTSQSGFATALFDPDIAVPTGISGAPKKRFSVYRNNVMVGLIDALGDIFPTVKNLVGEEFFAAMARIHISTEPPSSPLMFEYGAGFSAFIETFEHASELPFLPDVARLERAWLDCFHEADAPIVSLQTLSAVAQDLWPSIRFVLHPAARVLEFEHAAVSIVSRDRQGLSLDGLDPFSAETGLLTRPDCDVELRYLPDGGAQFIRALGNGLTLGQAADEALAQFPDFDLPQAICGMFVAGAVTELVFAGDQS